MTEPHIIDAILFMAHNNDRLGIKRALQAEKKKVLDTIIKRIKSCYDGTDDEGEANAYSVCLSTLEEFLEEGMVEK